MQPIDVSINKPFKAAVDREATAHMQANLTDYVQGRMSVTSGVYFSRSGLQTPGKKLQLKRRPLFKVLGRSAYRSLSMAPKTSN